MGDGRKAHTLLLGKPQGKCPRGKPKIRWKDNNYNYGFEGNRLCQDRMTCRLYLLIRFRLSSFGMSLNTFLLLISRLTMFACPGGNEPSYSITPVS